MEAAARAELNELLRRLADGDRSAFDVAYAKLWPLVRAFCLRALPDGSGEDAAQLALLKVFERAATFDTHRDALPWVLSIAAWECRTLRRRRGRAREVGESAASEVIDTSPSPEALAQQAELDRDLRAILSTLSDIDRDTLERILNDDDARGVDAATFRKRRERAFARLKSAWRKVYGD